MSESLEIKDLHVKVEGKEILKGLNIKIKQGEIHAIMGPNGSGKSTLANTLMGHPIYDVERGQILLNKEDVLQYKANERAKKGLFLAFQYPTAVPGVTMFNFLRTAYNAVKVNGHAKDKKQELTSVLQFSKLLNEKLKMLKMDESFVKRYVNDGFSGGEKKRSEILQMALLEPKFAVLDETDSGLDVDALRIVSEGINKLSGPNLGVLIITHYQRILRYIKPDHVHVMIDGKIVKSGGHDLAEKLEEEGYDWIIKEIKNE
ncbi:MAG: Fe-S cluster assembly ATPase SufC [Candidatus Aenigmarchaeota archaeon]|nr:Fe-S cluster assembly ATPase SufC [Candidatus Aenigmarchaeota archaeon]